MAGEEIIFQGSIAGAILYVLYKIFYRMADTIDDLSASVRKLAEAVGSCPRKSLKK